MNIYGKKVVLRAIEKEDLENLRDVMNDPEVERLVGGWAFPVSRYEQQIWYENSIKNKSTLRWMIETQHDGVIGMTGLWNIDWKYRNAFNGIKISNKEFRGKGYGTDTVMAVMRYAFEELNLKRLDGDIVEYNEKSKNLYCKRCGWKEEGVRKKHVFKNNKYYDSILVGILDEEYFELIKDNRYWEDEK
ncbi:GNAT family N-acetyltransferase [Clostridium hydrogenum]|uniref:GNAT family N-acetyltransferase n=1 Tax=Clostridium hydrogenum TaxID=2855764 RepID=UPI001F41F116|nr:GNAT family protein [Clostridium hydrogenum]